MYPIITINNITPPSPIGVEVEVQDVDYNSQRSADATLIRNVVATKVKFTLEFGIQQKAELQSFLASIKHDEFPIEYHDIFTDEVTTGTFYHGNIKLAVKYISNSTTLFKSWTVSFIEY